MVLLEVFLCLAFIGVTGWLVLKKYNPSTILFVMGMLMLALATILGISDPTSGVETTGSKFMDLFKIVETRFGKSFVSFGLLIMTISGYVAVMNKMKATEAMVYIASKPLSIFKGNPYLAAIIVIPICTCLFLCINSASGLGLLLVATIYPILLNIGVSKPTALSVIIMSVIFDMGPASANTQLAAAQYGGNGTDYFIQYQIPMIIVAVICLMLTSYFSNRFLDKKDVKADKEIFDNATSGEKPSVPLWFAFFPIIPLVLLILLSPSVGLVDFQASTSMIMLICALFASIFLCIYKKSLKAGCDMMKSFWDGLGSSFGSVIVLTVAALIFADGLTSLNFIDLIVNGCNALNMGAVAVTIVFSLVVLFCSAMMGSGNAAFFAFGPMIPLIASKFGITDPAGIASMILPIQLLASMGRGVSPISAVVVAVGGSTNTNTMDMVKRTMIPILTTAVVMIIFNFIVNW
ncbi:MAG: C4-dicarboxylate transporter DcuC [Bacteroidales bacterium]|nr:C4-dicarboxylate transporter DcuC [Bacteroidales bacterium]